MVRFGRARDFYKPMMRMDQGNAYWNLRDNMRRILNQFERESGLEELGSDPLDIKYTTFIEHLDNAFTELEMILRGAGVNLGLTSHKRTLISKELLICPACGRRVQNMQCTGCWETGACNCEPLPGFIPASNLLVNPAAQHGQGNTSGG